MSLRREKASHGIYPRHAYNLDYYETDLCTLNILGVWFAFSQNNHELRYVKRPAWDPPFLIEHRNSD